MKTQKINFGKNLSKIDRIDKYKIQRIQYKVN